MSGPVGGGCLRFLEAEQMSKCEWHIEWIEADKQWIVVSPIGVIVLRCPHKYQAELALERWDTTRRLPS